MTQHPLHPLASPALRATADGRPASGLDGGLDGQTLLARLPRVRGRLAPMVPLAGLTWFGVGGPAEVLFKPADEADLADFLVAKPAGVPVTLLGVGSNLLVRDGGIPGVVVRLGRAFAGITVEDGALSCGAAALDSSIARVARDTGLAGLEFLVTIPGTLGGALRMNAGAHGRETKDILLSARILDARGDVQTLEPGALKLSYRQCGLPDSTVFLGARLAGSPADRAAITARMEAMRAARQASQPQGGRTGGSTFANPDPEAAGGRRAWELIDAAGCRGLTLGGARVSDKHCNFLINTGGATAAEIEALGETVRQRVYDTSGVSLRWEIKRLGLPAPGQEPLATPDTKGGAA